METHNTASQPNSIKRLSKSKFKLALECPAKLNYIGVPGYVNTNDTNEMLKGLAEGGHQIGRLAQWIYSKEAKEQDIPFHEVTGGLEQQLRETADWLEYEDVVLFEPTFVVDHFVVRVDVLVKKGDKISLIEVKSKSFDASEFPRNSKGVVKTEYAPYLQDVAFQTMVVQRCHPDWQITPFLMMPNKEVATATGDLHHLFSVSPDPQNKKNVIVALPDLNAEIDHAFLQAVNVETEVQALFAGTLQVASRPPKQISIGMADHWGENYASGAVFPPQLNATQCAKCEFYAAKPTTDAKSGFHECWKRAGVPNFSEQVVREDLVIKLFGNSKVKQSALDEYRFYLSELTEEDIGAVSIDIRSTAPISLNQRQWMQASGEIPEGRDEYFNVHGFREEEKSWSYPYYFLDFEGAKSALPIRSNQTPNQQIIFQYSIHVLHEDGRLVHHEQYLDLTQDHEQHARMLRQLRNDLGERGTIFRWHDYENTVLNALRAELMSAPHPPPDREELIAFIDLITKPSDKDKSRQPGARNMVDQAKLAAGYYFHKSTHGSSSIKKVLPAIFQSSAYLRDTYSKPIYGADAELPSWNHRSPISWWQSENNQVLDPYEVLRRMSPSSNANSELDLIQESAQAEEVFSIADGGAAMMAYMRLMSGAIPQDKHDEVKQMMLRYCELDTLAMAMIMQAWQHHSE